MAKKTHPKIEAEPVDDGLGVFDPSTVEVKPAAHYTIPALEAYLDNPTQETHLEACKLLHKCGPLALDGIVYELRAGKVHAFRPHRDPKAVVPDDPNEEV